MNRDGMLLILFGVVSIISVITPDKSFGMGIGIGLILTPKVRSPLARARG